MTISTPDMDRQSWERWKGIEPDEQMNTLGFDQSLSLAALSRETSLRRVENARTHVQLDGRNISLTEFEQTHPQIVLGQE